MKKSLFILLILVLASGVALADTINLGNFPVGSWLDPNYDAVWEFSTGNIRILSPAGEVHYDFADKGLENFKVSVEGGNPVITFSSEDTRRSYKFTKPMTNTDVILEIEAPWNPDYRVEMKRQ
jgi:hypothetical protein